MKNTVIVTPGRTRAISRLDPLVDVICEHAGWDPNLLNDPAGIRRIQELTNDPAWCADSLNAGDRLREYLDRDVGRGPDPRDPGHRTVRMPIALPRTRIRGGAPVKDNP